MASKQSSRAIAIIFLLHSVRQLQNRSIFGALETFIKTFISCQCGRCRPTTPMIYSLLHQFHVSLSIWFLVVAISVHRSISLSIYHRSLTFWWRVTVTVKAMNVFCPSYRRPNSVRDVIVSLQQAIYLWILIFHHRKLSILKYPEHLISFRLTFCRPSTLALSMHFSVFLFRPVFSVGRLIWSIFEMEKKIKNFIQLKSDLRLIKTFVGRRKSHANTQTYNMGNSIIPKRKLQIQRQREKSIENEGKKTKRKLKIVCFFQSILQSFSFSLCHGNILDNKSVEKEHTSRLVWFKMKHEKRKTWQESKSIKWKCWCLVTMCGLSHHVTSMTSANIVFTHSDCHFSSLVSTLHGNERIGAGEMNEIENQIFKRSQKSWRQSTCAFFNFFVRLCFVIFVCHFDWCKWFRSEFLVSLIASQSDSFTLVDSTERRNHFLRSFCVSVYFSSTSFGREMFSLARQRWIDKFT